MTTAVLKLNYAKRIEIEPTSPFCFDGTVWKPLHFPSNDQTWKPGVLWQTIKVQDIVYGVVLKNKGEVSNPLVELTVFGGKPLTGKQVEDIADEVRWRYDFDSQEISSFVRRFRTDRLLGPVLRKWSGTRMKSGYSLYEYLVITVMLQNTVVRRSVQMLQSLFEAYGRLVEFDGMKLWSFWGPEAINCTSEDELQRLKVGCRARILKRQAAQFAAGEIDTMKLGELKGDALLETLDGIYGVGPQSAGYLSSKFFHDYDMMKSISPWDAKIYSHLIFGHGKASPKRILSFLQKNYAGFKGAIEYLMTDISWKNKEAGVQWLKKLIRL